METTFEDKLRAIRDTAARRQAEDLKSRADRALARSELLIETCDFRKRVEGAIEQKVRQFGAATSDFVLSRSCFDGQYMLALRTIDKPYSRLSFMLRVDSEKGTMTLSCRKTVRNRDLEKVVTEQSLDGDGLSRIEAMVEAQFMDFARAYFD